MRRLDVSICAAGTLYETILFEVYEEKYIASQLLSGIEHKVDANTERHPH